MELRRSRRKSDALKDQLAHESEQLVKQQVKLQNKFHKCKQLAAKVHQKETIYGELW